VSTFAVGQAGVNPPLTFLDAGAALSLSATAGQFNVPRTSPGIYAASLSQTITIPGFPGGIPGQGNQTPVLEPGNFVMRGSGGADVGPFEARVSIPGNFIWTNQDAVTQIVRSRELEITWSGGSPANEYVFISGTSIGQGGVGASFVCTERSTAGRFAVPVEVLSSLPASILQQGNPTGSLSVANYPSGLGARFTAPGIDVGLFTYATAHFKNLVID
jgi:hypothetical protein